ncbi:MAG: hypothetical protein Q8P41_30030 [Pseudomonadota bacterium]|nr:hypothetical protein [Pseudomonadota bacterium]
MAARGALAEYVDDLQAGGRLTFTRDEAMDALGVSMDALKQAALRLAKRGRLVSPRRGFYVIVPLEYRAEGVPPLDRWLPELLRFHGAQLLAREELDGEVVLTVDRRLRPMQLGATRLRFVSRAG